MQISAHISLGVIQRKQSPRLIEDLKLGYLNAKPLASRQGNMTFILKTTGYK